MIALKNELKKGVAASYLQTDLEISNVVLGLSMASNSKRSQLSEDDIDLLLGSSKKIVMIIVTFILATLKMMVTLHMLVMRKVVLVSVRFLVVLQVQVLQQAMMVW